MFEQQSGTPNKLGDLQPSNSTAINHLKSLGNGILLIPILLSVGTLFWSFVICFEAMGILIYFLYLDTFYLKLPKIPQSFAFLRWGILVLIFFLPFVFEGLSTASPGYFFFMVASFYLFLVIPSEIMAIIYYSFHRYIKEDRLLNRSKLGVVFPVFGIYYISLLFSDATTPLGELPDIHLFIVIPILFFLSFGSFYFLLTRELSEEHLKKELRGYGPAPAIYEPNSLTSLRGPHR